MKNHLKKLALILLVGLIYYIFISITDIAIPCIFRKLTGFRCPGCGISTMFVRLFHGDIKGAFRANQLIFITLPLWIIEIIFYPIINEKYKKINNIIMYVAIVMFLIFMILRNAYNF